MSVHAAISDSDAPATAARAERGSLPGRSRFGGIELGPYLYPILTILVLLAGWEGATRLLRIPRLLLPAPTEVVATLVAEAPLLLQMSTTTAQEILIGFALSVVFGVPLGAFIVYSRRFEQAVYPLLVASQTVPKAALAPIFVVWLGLGMTSKVLIAFVIAFFPIVIDTVVGLRSISPEVLYLVRSMGANPFQTFWLVRLPNALPNIFGGLKVASTLAVVGAIVGEFVSADKGLGYLVLVANGNLNTPLVFAVVTTLSLMGVIFYFAIEAVEKFVIRWHVSTRLQEAAGTP